MLPIKNSTLHAWPFPNLSLSLSLFSLARSLARSPGMLLALAFRQGDLGLSFGVAPRPIGVALSPVEERLSLAKECRKDKNVHCSGSTPERQDVEYLLVLLSSGHLLAASTVHLGAELGPELCVSVSFMKHLKYYRLVGLCEGGIILTPTLRNISDILSPHRRSTTKPNPIHTIC